MSKFIPRDFHRTPHDDFELNVRPYMNEDYGAIEVRSEDGNLLGWDVKPWNE